MTRRDIEQIKREREDKLRAAFEEQRRREREWREVVHEIASYENAVRCARQGGRHDGE